MPQLHGGPLHEAIDDGLTEDLVCSLEQAAEADDLSPAERAALRFADLFATNHLAIDDAVYDDLREHFTEGDRRDRAATVRCVWGGPAGGHVDGHRRSARSLPGRRPGHAVGRRVGRGAVDAEAVVLRRLSTLSRSASQGADNDPRRGDRPDMAEPKPLSIGEPLRVLIVAGIPVGVRAAGRGSRFAMFMLRLTSDDSVIGATSDDHFEIGRVTFGGTLNLLILGSVVGLIGAAVYQWVRPWLIGPHWFGLLRWAWRPERSSVRCWCTRMGWTSSSSRRHGWR